MKKSFKLWSSLMVFLTIFLACQDDDLTSTDVGAPSNLEIDVVVADDNSGNVTVTPTADNAVNYNVIFLPSADPVVISEGESASFRYTDPNELEQTITVIAFSSSGLSTSRTIAVNLDLSLTMSPSQLAILAGGDGVSASSRRWVWDRLIGGHFGVGPLDSNTPEFFSAGPNEVNPCVYDDVLTFSNNGDGTYTFRLDPGEDNLTFINWADVNRFFPDALPQGEFADECRDITDQIDFETDFTIIDNEDGTQTLDVSGSFLSYYVVASGMYQILEFNENRLSFRGVSDPFNGDGPLAWYSSFIPEDQSATGGGVPLETQFTNLIWADEFNVDGIPDPANWDYDLGGGGFGNGESQFYTQDPENVTVEDGLLRITAISSGTSGPDVYFYDDLQLSNSNGSTVTIVEDFQGTAPSFIGFEGATSSVTDNPDPTGINTSTRVAQFTKNTGAQFFAGIFFDLDAPLDLSTTSTFTMNTWSPSVGAVMRVKFENTNDSSEFVEIDATTTVTNSWEELTYDFSNSPDFNYDRVVLFFDFGEEGPASGLTSARIKTEDLQEFTFGRAEIRARLPTGIGTWPALWMLGANFPEVGWPQAGEIDIMEHVGRLQDIIHGTTHDPANFAGNGRTGSTLVENVSEEFRIYEMEWTDTEIQFAVDGQVYHTVSNDSTCLLYTSPSPRDRG